MIIAEHTYDNDTHIFTVNKDLNKYNTCVIVCKFNYDYQQGEHIDLKYKDNIIHNISFKSNKGQEVLDGGFKANTINMLSINLSQNIICITPAYSLMEIDS